MKRTFQRVGKNTGAFFYFFLKQHRFYAMSKALFKCNTWRSQILQRILYFSYQSQWHNTVSEDSSIVSSGRNILILRGGLTKVFLFILTKFHLSPMPVCTRAMYSCATWKNLFHQPHLDLSHNSVCISCPKPKNHKDPGRLSHSQK